MSKKPMGHMSLAKRTWIQLGIGFQRVGLLGLRLARAGQDGFTFGEGRVCGEFA